MKISVGGKLTQLVVSSGGSSVLLQSDVNAIIGRDDNVELTITNPRVSRHHLAVSCIDGIWTAQDLSSSNGTFLDGNRVDSVEIQKSAILLLGGDGGASVAFSVLEGQSAAQPNIEMPAGNSARRFSLGARTRIGSAAGNEIQITDSAIDAWHAEIVLNRQKAHELVDLDSSNGTFVNELRLKRHLLQVGDVIRFGLTSLTYTGSTLEPGDALSGYGLVASGLNVVIGGKTLLDNVSFELKPNSVTAVIGPSGAGKSTVLNALTGKLPLTSGEVLFGNKNLIRDYDQLKNKIGFVPQSDLIHSNLSTAQALKFGAALRFPKSTSQELREKRVEEVLVELALEHRKDLRIEKLSGGQRKRASVALELLTEPILLFLDEPTSGLDPGLDRQVMQLLRKLADKGKTVVIVTHSTINLDLADDVVIMAPGGKLAYFGSPSGVMKSFNAQTWPDVFENLVATGSEIRTLAPKRFFGFKPDRLQETQLSKTPMQGWFRQFSVLAKRYLAVIAADRGYSLFLAFLPFALSAVGLLTGSKYGLGEGSESMRFLNPDARSILLILLLGSTFIGTSSSIQEIVRERVIFLREQSVGLRYSAYVASKMAVLGVIVTIQVAIFAGITVGVRPTPDSGLFFGSGFFEILAALVLVALCSMILGLLISSLVETSEVTMPILVVVTMVQIVFSGAVPLGLEGVLDFVGFAIPAYWAMNMMSSTVNMNELSYVNQKDFVEVWTSSQENFVSAAAGMVGSIFVVAVALFVVMAYRRKR